jgi:hypothetical protein
MGTPKTVSGEQDYWLVDTGGIGAVRVGPILPCC